MPVTAKLSKAFYERLGEDIANELVEWFNLVDATYRSDLRDINELNFARFDAKMEQRFAQFEAKTEQRFAQFEAKTEQRLAQFEARIERRFAATDARIEQCFSQMMSEISQRFDGQNRMLLAGWGIMLAAILGLLIKSF